MILPTIESHLRTSNIYVQRQITRDNISRIQNFRWSKEYKTLNHKHRREFTNQLIALHNLLKQLNMKIEKIEQTSFPFGNPIPFSNNQ